MKRWPWLGPWGALALASCLDPNPMFVEATDTEDPSATLTAYVTEADTEIPLQCGDGVIDPGETCDEGPDNAPDQRCTPACQVNRCGDGFDGPDEACDLGEANGEGSTCTLACVTNVCGDGVRGLDEDCDHGEGNDPGGACRDDCKLNECGDGHVGPGEACDDGEANANDASCRDDCQENVCGDGLVGPGEGCDDGNLIEGDACTSTCAPKGCGNGIVEAGEACDEGPKNSPEGTCLPTCVAPACGDGATQASNAEDCDDGNLNTNDACTDMCRIAKCGDGILRFDTEECDDGNTGDLDACNAKCRLTPKFIATPPLGDSGTMGEKDGKLDGLHCEPERVMVGAVGSLSADGYVSSIGPVCAKISVGIGFGKFFVLVSPPELLGEFGPQTDEKWEAMCAPEAMVVGFQGAIGMHVTALSIRCAKLDLVSYFDGTYGLELGPTKGTVPVGSAPGEPAGIFDCPPGGLAHGIAGWTELMASGFDGLAMGCTLPFLLF